MNVKVTDRLTPDGRRFMQQIKELSELEVRIGFQQGEAQEEDGTDICDVAAWNELGTSNIPSRPFLRKSVDENEQVINDFLKDEMAMLKKSVFFRKVLFRKRSLTEIMYPMLHPQSEKKDPLNR